MRARVTLGEVRLLSLACLPFPAASIPLSCFSSRGTKWSEGERFVRSRGVADDYDYDYRRRGEHDPAVGGGGGAREGGERAY